MNISDRVNGLANSDVGRGAYKKNELNLHGHCLIEWKNGK
jgi:hypothetical protein